MMKLGVLICALLVSLALRILNPEMTEMQLLLEFWWVWLIILLAGVLTVLIDGKRKM